MARRKQAAALLVIAVVHVYLIHWVWEAFDVRGAACPVMLQRRNRARIQQIRRNR